MKMRYKQLVDDFAAKIHNGNLRAGTRLPTHRSLAQLHHISLATATRVYQELAAMGLVTGETGRGTFVKDQALALTWGAEQSPLPAQVLDLNFSSPVMEQQVSLVRRVVRDLASSGDFEALLRYQTQAGRIGDREKIAAYLSTLGIAVNLDCLFIVCGAQHGLCVTMMGVFRAGDVIAVDALTYPGFKLLAQQLGIELLAIPANADCTGPNLAVLRQHCRQRNIRAVYCMPTLHNPLGWVMDLKQRLTLVEIAREFDLILIEDAAYAYLAENPPPSLAALAPERTIYINGFSKNIAAGLRVGMLHCFDAVKLQIQQAIRASIWNTPALMTAVVAALIQQGQIQKLEALKRQDAERRQAIATQVFSAFDTHSHPHSYFLWIKLGDQIRTEQVVQMLLAHQIGISSAEAYCTSKDVPHAIRISLSAIPFEDVFSVLSSIKAVIEYHQDL